MSVLGKSLELIAKLQGKMLISHTEKKKHENWDENEEENGSEEVEVESSDNIVVEDMDVTHWDVVMELNKMTIHKLVTKVLNLPSSLSSRFEIEATRLQLGASLYNFKSVDCIQGCDGQSDEGSSDFVLGDVYDDDNDYDDDDDNDSYEYDDSYSCSGFFSSDEDCNYAYFDSEFETGTDESLSNDVEC
jgi:hypothetical protein